MIVCGSCGAEVFWAFPRPEDPCPDCGVEIGAPALPTAEKRVGPRRGAAVIFSRCSDGQLGHPMSRVAVVNRMCNYSAFNGYRWTPSDYSLLRCECGALWRTKARYVDQLPNERPTLA